LSAKLRSGPIGVAKYRYCPGGGGGGGGVGVGFGGGVGVGGLG